MSTNSTWLARSNTESGIRSFTTMPVIEDTRSFRDSRMVKSVPPGVRIRRVWVMSRPLGSVMVTTMLEVMTKAFIRTAP